MLRLLGTRYLLATALAAALAAVAIGIPTDLLPNPWFKRMTPVRTTDLVLWPLTSLAAGALLATYALPRSAGRQSDATAGVGGGLLGVLAVGCPVCNKLVVLALGFSGALTYFAPIQPALGALAILMTLFVLRRRLLALQRGCPADPIVSPAPASVSAS